MKIEGKLHQLAHRVLEDEAGPRRQRAHWRPPVDLRTPKLAPVKAWGSWTLDADGARLVNPERKTTLDLLAAAVDPGHLWETACQAADLGEFDLVAALALLFPGPAVIRAARLSEAEIRARVEAYAAGRAPKIIVRGPIRGEEG